MILPMSQLVGLSGWYILYHLLKYYSLSEIREGENIKPLLEEGPTCNPPDLAFCPSSNFSSLRGLSGRGTSQCQDIWKPIASTLVR